MTAILELAKHNPDSQPPLSPWPELRAIKDDLPPAPAFDAHTLLPEALAEFVLDESDRMSTAPEYIASTLIVAMGAVIGAKCALKPKRRDDWIVTPNLWGAIVGQPSSKKTPSANAVMRFIDGLEAKENEKLADSKKVYAAQMVEFEAWQEGIKASIKSAIKSKDAGKRDKVAALSDELLRLQEPEEPIARRFKVNDSTTEKLVDLESKNPFGLFVFRDELMGLLVSWKKEGREGDKTFYLEAWNGTGSYNSDRIGRGSQFVPVHCLSVFGGIQPDLLQRYLVDIMSSMDNDGRIQRFQVMVYPDQPDWKWVDRYPTKGAREAVRDIFCHLAGFVPEDHGAEPASEYVKLPAFSFNDEAQDIFIEWSSDLHTKREPEEANPLMRQTLAKYEKLFCAVALIIHLASSRTGQVDADSATRAAAWCEFLEGHARRIFALVESAQTTTAQMLSRRLVEGKLANGFTSRDVARKGWRGISSSDDAERALAILEDHGWVLGQEESQSTGRPTTRYTLNPKARRQP